METLNHLQDTENDLSCALSLNTIFRFFLLQKRLFSSFVLSKILFSRSVIWLSIMILMEINLPFQVHSKASDQVPYGLWTKTTCLNGDNNFLESNFVSIVNPDDLWVRPRILN